jgi:hypothetical protein
MDASGMRCRARNLSSRPRCEAQFAKSRPGLVSRGEGCRVTDHLNSIRGSQSQLENFDIVYLRSDPRVALIKNRYGDADLWPEHTLKGRRWAAEVVDGKLIRMPEALSR